MLLRNLLILLAGFSFLGCLGPKLTVCVVDLKGFQCFDERTQKSFVVSPEEASEKNYIAMPPQDYGQLLDFIKNKCGNAQ